MALYKNIFLADDDPEDQEIFLDALRTVDSSILCFFASDGEKAVQVLKGDFFEKPDLIFLDLNMPFLNGKQVLASIKQSDDLKTIPVVMYSTHFNENDLAEIRQLGAVHHLVKPTGFNSLVSSLESILSTEWVRDV